MHVHDLEAFAAVIESGSIVGASTRLHLTQPGISRRVQNLEEALGVTLLDRQSKPLRPTVDGRKAYDMARRVLASVSELRSAVALDGELSGDLRIGVSAFLPDAALAKSFAPLRQTHPKIALYVSHGWSADLIARLDEGALDAAMVCVPSETQPPQEFTRLPIGRFPVLFVAGRDLNVPRRPSLKELSAYPWIVNQDGCGMRRTVRRAFESQGLTFKLAVEAQSPEFRMTLVAQGLGIGITCAPWLASSSAREALRVIEVPDFSSQICVWLLHRLAPGRMTSALTMLQQSLEYACNATSKKLSTAPARKPAART